MNHIVFILLMLIALQDPSFDEQTIYGSWKWAESSGGLLGNTLTPENINSSRKIVFTKDHVYMFYVKDSLALRQNYQIQNEKTIFSFESQPVLRISGLSKTQSILMTGKDTLRLKDNVYDGYVHLYVKMPE